MTCRSKLLSAIVAAAGVTVPYVRMHPIGTGLRFLMGQQAPRQSYESAVSSSMLG